MHGSGAVRTYQVIFPVHHALLPPLDVYFMPEMKCLRSGGTFPSHHQVINSNIAQLPWKLVTIATMPWWCERHLNCLCQEHLIRFQLKCFQNVKKGIANPWQWLPAQCLRRCHHVPVDEVFSWGTWSQVSPEVLQLGCIPPNSEDVFCSSWALWRRNGGQLWVSFPFFFLFTQLWSIWIRGTSPWCCFLFSFPWTPKTAHHDGWEKCSCAQADDSC